VKAFRKANEVFTSEDSVPSELRYLLVDAATRLARAKETSPDSPHGMLVLEVLNDAAEDPDAGSFLA
jgi:hypothetical protein